MRSIALTPLLCALLLPLSVAKAPAQTSDDYLCYKARVSKGTAKFEKTKDLAVTDSLESGAVDVKKPKLICAPAAASGTQPNDGTTHLAAYSAKAVKGSPKHTRLEDFRVVTALGELFIDTVKEGLLLVPTAVDNSGPTTEPTGHTVDAFKCYKTKKPKGFKKILGQDLSEWMDGARTYDLKKPSHFCPPADIEAEGIKDADSHLVCYKTKVSQGQPRHQPLTGLYTAGRFGALQFDTKKVTLLCTPTTAVQGCGDGLINEAGEQCDDGNKTSGDGCSAGCQSELPLTIKAINMNILHDITQGNVGFDQLTDRLTLLADELAAADPDIVTLQEVVLGANDASQRLVDDLANRYGMVYHRISYGSTVGNAVLSRWPVALEETVRLPTQETVSSHPDRRFAARAVVSAPIGPLDVYSMHMCAGGIGCTPADRVVQMDEFIDFVESTHSSRHPAIVGGDFNSHHGTGPDADPANGPAMQAMLDRGWTPVFDGSDAPCAPPTDRSGCTGGITDLLVTADTTSVRIDNILLVAGSASSSQGPATSASELGPSSRFAGQPLTDPNPRCEFTPRDYCASNWDCGLLEPQVYCGRNDFCQTIIPCTEDVDCPSETYGEMVCGKTLWVSDHVGLQTTLLITEGN